MPVIQLSSAELMFLYLENNIFITVCFSPLIDILEQYNAAEVGSFGLLSGKGYPGYTVKLG